MGITANVSIVTYPFTVTSETNNITVNTNGQDAYNINVSAITSNIDVTQSSTSVNVYTDAVVIGSPLNLLSVNDTGGDGSLSYSNTTGVFTYTGPNTSNYRSAFSAGQNIDITNGVISVSGSLYNDSNVRAAIGAVDAGGDGSFSYNESTGLFTYTGPTSSETRAHFSAGSGLLYSNGVYSIDSTIATKTYADSAASNAIASIIDSAPSTLDTLNELAAALGDDANFSTTITNSLSNKLNTSDFNTTANTWLSGKSTSDIIEGSNQYFTFSICRSVKD